MPSAQTFSDANLPFEQGSQWVCFDYAFDPMLALAMDGRLVRLNAAAHELLSGTVDTMPEILVDRPFHNYLNAIKATQYSWATLAAGTRIPIAGELHPLSGDGCMVSGVVIAHALDPHHLVILRQTDASSVASPAQSTLTPMEAALRLSEHRYRAVVNSQTEMICRFLPSGVLTFVNAAYCRMFGKTEAELIDENFLTLVPESDRPWVEQQMAELRQLTPERPEVLHEHRVETAAGAMLWHEWSNRGIFDDHGRLIEVQAIGRDITRQRQLENALKQSELKYKTLFETLPIGLSITDPDGKLVEVNPASEKILGLRSDEHINRTIDAPQWHVIQPDGSLLASEDYASVQALREGRVIRDMEMGVQRPDGQVEWLSVTAAPLPLDDYGVAIAFVPLTAAKVAQSALQQQEQQFRALIENGFGLIGILDEHFCLRYISPTAQRLGYQPEEMLDRPALNFVHPSDRAHVQRILEQSAATPNLCFTVEFRAQHRWGSDRVYQAVLMNLFQNPAVGGLVFNCRDITDLKATETTLHHYERLVSLVTDGIVLIDRSFTYRMVNPAYAARFNKTPADIVGRHVSELVGPAFFEAEIRPRLERCMGGESLQFEAALSYGSPDPQQLSITYSPYREMDGSISGVIGVSHDLTPLRQAEQDIQSAQQRYFRLLQSIDGIVWELDVTSWRFTFVSQKAEQVLGYPIADWLEEDNFWDNHLHPDDRDAAIASCLASMNRGESHVLEYRMVAADGRSLWFRDHTSVEMQNGTPVRMWGWLTDITEQKALERHRDNLINVLESTPDYVSLATADGQLTYLNRAGRRIIGIEPDADIRTVHYLETLPFQHRERVETESMADLIANDRWMGESVLLASDGEEIPILQAILVHRDDDGNIEFFSAIGRDIRALKQAQESLLLQAERERLLASITKHIRRSLELEQILQATVDDVQALLECDRALILKLYPDSIGKVEAEAQAPHLQTLRGHLFSTHCMDHCLSTACPLTPGMTDDGQRYPLTSCAVTGLLGLDNCAHIAVPILQGATESQAKLWGLLVVHQQVVRHWQRWEVEILEAIADQVGIAIHQANLYDQLQRFNLCLEAEVQRQTAQFRQSLNFEALLRRITDKVRDSLDEDHILQAAVEELAIELEVECCDTALYNADRTTSTIAYEHTRNLAPAQGTTFALAEAIHLDVYPQLFEGQPVLFCNRFTTQPLRAGEEAMSILACPIRDEHGVLGDMWLFRPRGFVFSDQEVRLVEQVASQCAIALRQARLYEASQVQVRELERLNLLKDDFLSTVSHELRTPVSNVKMSAQMLEVILQSTNMLSTHERLAEYLHILNTECDREIRLVNDLLDLLRLDAEADPLMPLDISLQSWIPAIAEAFEQRIAEQHQQLELAIAPDLPPLHTDLGYLERILSELLTNACKYTPAGEQISIRATLIPHHAESHDLKRVKSIRQDEIQICVSNTGITLPPNELIHIFDKFYRLPNADPWKHSGTGLGLALTQRLVQYLGGTIQATSTDNCITFTLRFPQTSRTPLETKSLTAGHKTSR
ncbi:PAS domain S-box protein [Vacuolonema iberomarrocanum]|uniref:PAS domain S-box protein n=1 Tax=Vacuolonema iberomarrocanum TaxID=3454632 RepID=UPI0019D9402C|nr:PAS domain S-box protein [filamentous cyanobacterium LEGE 07170]